MHEMRLNYTTANGCEPRALEPPFHELVVVSSCQQWSALQCHQQAQAGGPFCAATTAAAAG
jgi:hypothetical protein